MSSLHKLQDLVQTVRHTTQGESPDMDAVRTSIYDVVTHAFMGEVLTLVRMNGIIRAVRIGVEDSRFTACDAAPCALVLARCEAYRGLCSAADAGLTALGLAYAELLKFHACKLSTDFETLLLHEILVLKRQLELVTLGADWNSNSQVARLHSHWFGQLLVPPNLDTQPQAATVTPWSGRFFQACGYEVPKKNSDPHASLMLLGLLTSGVLTGLRSPGWEI